MSSNWPPLGIGLLLDVEFGSTWVTFGMITVTGHVNQELPVGQRQLLENLPS